MIHNVINGELRATAATLDNVNPANLDVIDQVCRSTPADVDAAVAAARAALPEWSATPLGTRLQILHRIAAGIASHQEELARMETTDNGKPITTSRTIDIPRAIANFNFFADFAAEFHDEEFPMAQGYNRTHRKPVGVVGLITPWNLPLYLLSWKVAPALAMGNTIVAKPSEFTPQTATKLAQICLEAGLPPGVFNVVHGLGSEAGHALAAHPDVNAISFTGGTATGRIVAATAAPMFKKLSLELGGKNPTIILPDADVSVAAAGAIRAGFTNGGQICLCGSRILVHADLFEPFLVALQDRMKQLRPGNPMLEETAIGPVIGTAHQEKVRGYIQAARDAGLDVRQFHEVPQIGAYVAATLIVNPPQDAPCVQEEIFGPVVTLQTFASTAEAIALANDVQYGLAASVWGGADAQEVAQALDTGMVWVNDWLVRDLRVPFGGMKSSGVGREGGRWSLEFYSEARNVYVAGPPTE